MKLHSTHWFHDNWRPFLAWLYGFICAFDFVFGPLVYFWVQQFEVSAANDAYREWKPLTLQGGGIFHLSMCAVLGVSAYGRTQEKIGVMQTETVKSSYMPNPNERAPL